MIRSIHTFDRFAPEAPALRQHFDRQFANPREAAAERFVWDYWHVPGQYTALRTPAWLYFPKRLYSNFHRRLVDFGRRVLGCHDISPPWLSCYVDGCRQELHGDLPHGPFAFVYSLTPWSRRKFSGGETIIVKDQVLEWWQGFESLRSIEEGDLIHSIPSRMNRLVVFDPRLPHGVRPVHGTHDPREGRLVIHGWFVQPRPFVEGSLSRREFASFIERITLEVLPRLLDRLEPAGLISLGFTIDRRGRVRDSKILSDTTRTPHTEEKYRRLFVRNLKQSVGEIRFKPSKGTSSVTLPLIFQR